MSYDISSLFKRYTELLAVKNDISLAFNILVHAFENNGVLYTCGNGGSAADAEHMVTELMKGFLLPRKLNSEFKIKLISMHGETGKKIADSLQEGIRAVSLVGHPSLSTAFSNDVSPELVFAQQLYVLGRKNDVLIGFSTSGNSVNVVRTLQVALAIGMKTIIFTGATGGQCAGIADCSIKVPAEDTYKIQEYHLPVYHALCAMLEEYFYGGKK